MDRVLIGKSEAGTFGMWVSKPGINVISIAANSYFDNPYAYNENFNWALSNTHTHGYAPYYPPSVVGNRIFTSPEGTILFTSNANPRNLSFIEGRGEYDQYRLNGYFVISLNASPDWAQSTNANWINWTQANHLGIDQSFSGRDYPLLEMRVRKPPKSDGSNWTMQELGPSFFDFYVRFTTSNSTATYLGGTGNPYGGGGAFGRVAPSTVSWYHIMTGVAAGDPVNESTTPAYGGEWRILEYDMINYKLRVYDDTRTFLHEYPLSYGGNTKWNDDTIIDNLMFMFHYGDTYRPNQSVPNENIYPADALASGSGADDDPYLTRGLDHSEPDTEIDYIRAKKRDVPVKLGETNQDGFVFSSDWDSLGLVHQHGRVTIGNEYAWANGASKKTGTSHTGSQSGHINFPKLPYIPVVLFQRYDPDNPKISFPGGDKEFSFAHCDMTSNTMVWNPLSKQYQPSVNTSYGSEYRTFAYVRAGYDGFDLTCRNAIARDGYEWLFNYTPQEPYIEIYKGGNYDPETENPETFVMYPQTKQTSTGYSAGDGVAAVDNGIYSGGFDSSVMPTDGTLIYNSVDNEGKSEITLGLADSLPAIGDAYSAPSFRLFDDNLSLGFAKSESNRGVTGTQSFGDYGLNGINHAVGKMKDGILGVRRGKIITESNMPDDMQYHDQNLVDGSGGYYNAGVASSPIKNSAYSSGGVIGTEAFTNPNNDALDWSARDYMDGKLGYFAKYTGMDKGNCLPTFDWANKFGDWNVPQFNNFYQYIPEIGVGSYTSFKDAIGTSWTEENTKFLDDSMWLGYANNRFEYKGDIWHPQAPTKTYDELSGMFGYGGTIAHQGDWHDYAGVRYNSEGDTMTGLFQGHVGTVNYNLSYVGGYVGGGEDAGQFSARYDYKSYPGHGYLGIHLVSRYDSNALFETSFIDVENGPFAADVKFRNRYMYRPFNGVHALHTKDKKYLAGATDTDKENTYKANLAADYTSSYGFSGPGTQVTYGRLHDYGRTGMYAFTNPAFGLNSGVLGEVQYGSVPQSYEKVNVPYRWRRNTAIPPSKFWDDRGGSYYGNPAPGGTGTNEIRPNYPWDEQAGGISTLGMHPNNERTASFLGLPSLTELQTGYNSHKDSFVVSRWYTYPGATFAYDISNFSGPAHYDAWYKNDVTRETNDYKRRDYPQLYTGGWGNYGYFPTQEQLDQGKGATRLFPDETNNYHELVGLTQNYTIHGYGSMSPYTWNWEGAASTDPYGSYINGPFTIFKKRAYVGFEDNRANNLKKETKFAAYDVQTTTPKRVYLYFKPNQLHEEKQISKTFGIPNEIAGDYYVASTYHNERGAHPEVATSTDHLDSFHSKYLGDTGIIGDAYEHKAHTKQSLFDVEQFRNDTKNLIDASGGNVTTRNNRKNALDNWIDDWLPTLGSDLSKGMPYYHPVKNPSFNRQEMNFSTYPDYKLNEYLLQNGVDVTTLKPGDPIPIKADPYFAGMAFEGCNKITGAFTAHRFEFIIKKTKTHINHFRQSYEYNLPGRSGHRADTLRPIGYGLISNISGFDTFEGPPPAAHSYFDGRQLSGGQPYWVDGFEDRFNFYINTQLFNDSLQNTKLYRQLLIGLTYRAHEDGTIEDSALNHPAFANNYFSNKGWGNILREVKYDNEVYIDICDSEEIGDINPWRRFSFSANGTATPSKIYSGLNAITAWRDGYLSYPQPANSYEPIFSSTPYTYGGKSNTYSKVSGTTSDHWQHDVTSFDKQKASRLSVSMSRHGRDQMYRGIIGAVEVANTYFADYKATYWDSAAGQLKYWITGSTAVPSPPTNNDYYNLQRPLAYRPAKSQGASPETQMYGAYLGAPFNRYSDYHKAWGGLNSNWHSTGNYWEDDVLPGMCKADNALTNWGTVDLSKFDHNHRGYKWDTEVIPDATRERNIIWSPNKTGIRFDQKASTYKGTLGTVSGNKSTLNQKGGCYDGFALHERPEFQPVSGDGRYFGGVGGVDNWGGTTYNTWGPSMSVTPTVWELKWTSIQHPFGVAPTEAQDAATFYGATSIQNQTSYIGGAPTARLKLGDNGGQFKYSNGVVPVESQSHPGDGYKDPSAYPFLKGSTPMNYEWAIGGSQIQCNYWDRTLKVDRLTDTTLDSGPTEGSYSPREVVHANNGIQPICSLKVKSAYTQGGMLLVFAYDNGIVFAPDRVTTPSQLSDWRNSDVIQIIGNGKTFQTTLAATDPDPNITYEVNNLFGPVWFRLSIPEGWVNETFSIPSNISKDADYPTRIYDEKNYTIYNKTLAEDPTRHPAGSFRANTTYHFQYYYNQTQVNPPEYLYWVLKIPASMDAYNGESLI